MLAAILKVALSIVLAVAGSLAGQRWIARLYAAEPDVLSYPQSVGVNVLRCRGISPSSPGSAP